MFIAYTKVTMSYCTNLRTHATYLALAALTSLAPTNASGEELASELARVKAQGKLVVICFPQLGNDFITVNLERGPMKSVGGAEDFAGLDVEIMAAFADSLGVSLEIRPTPTPGFGELIPALLAGHGDIVASYFSNTPARRQRVDFSVPYFFESEVVLARKGSGFQSIEDLEGKKAAAISGSAKAGLIEKHGLGDGAPFLVEFYTDAFDALSQGQVDFTLISGGTVTKTLAANRGFEVAFTLQEGTPFGYAVRKGSDLLAPLNELLASFSRSGELDHLIRKWTGRRTDVQE